MVQDENQSNDDDGGRERNPGGGGGGTARRLLDDAIAISHQKTQIIYSLAHIGWDWLFLFFGNQFSLIWPIIRNNSNNRPLRWVER